jgi:hypothetical protein
MENEFGEAFRRKRGRLRLASEKVEDAPVCFKKYNIPTTLVDPPIVLELTVEAVPAGEGIRIAYIVHAPLYKIAPSSVIAQSGRDPNEITEGCWEDNIIDRPLWRRILDTLRLRSFTDVVMSEIASFHKQTEKEVRYREFKLERSKKTMECLSLKGRI